MSVLVHDKTFKEPVNWTTSLFLGAFHVGAIVALFFFTWKAFLTAFVLWWGSTFTARRRLVGAHGLDHHRARHA